MSSASDSDEDTRSPAQRIKDGQEEFAEETKAGDALLKKVTKGEARPLSDFFFCIISARRPGNVVKMESTLKGCSPTWIVATGDKKAYEEGGATKVIEGGGLCASRNKGLELAKKLNKPCVQLSDDLKTISFVSCKEDKNWTKPSSLSAANLRAKSGQIEPVSPGAAAQYIDYQSKQTQSKLGGTYPCGNAGQGCAMAPVAAEHFVVGDFFVSQPSATCRFDEELTLKEDYDFTCQHIHLYGRVARCNRLTLLAEHYVNEGGAVSIRNATEEKKNIKRLRSKWPGVFLGSPRGDSEVRLIWDKRDVVLGGNRVFETYDVRGKLTVYDKDEQKDIRRKRLAKGEKRLAEAHASCLEEALLPPAAKKAKK